MRLPCCRSRASSARCRQMRRFALAMRSAAAGWWKSAPCECEEERLAQCRESKANLLCWRDVALPHLEVGAREHVDLAVGEADGRLLVDEPLVVEDHVLAPHLASVEEVPPPHRQTALQNVQVARADALLRDEGPGLQPHRDRRDEGAVVVRVLVGRRPQVPDALEPALRRA